MEQRAPKEKPLYPFGIMGFFWLRGLATPETNIRLRFRFEPSQLIDLTNGIVSSLRRKRQSQQTDARVCPGLSAQHTVQHGTSGADVHGDGGIGVEPGIAQRRLLTTAEQWSTRGDRAARSRRRKNAPLMSPCPFGHGAGDVRRGALCGVPACGCRGGSEPSRGRSAVRLEDRVLLEKLATDTRLAVSN